MSEGGEARRLYKLLDPHRGKWVAVDFEWRTVLAADVDRQHCVQKAKGLSLPTEPIIYRVPAGPAPAGEPFEAPAPTAPGDAPKPVASPA